VQTAMTKINQNNGTASQRTTLTNNMTGKIVVTHEPELISYVPNLS